MQKVVTHNGGFHTDDVFAVATLQLHFGVENIEVIRTRDEEVISEADIVVDVGGVYDPIQKRFDHHQVGAPVRENGIPYAAFGLVWKEYGEKVSGSKEVADIIERKLVLPVDASDNGVHIFEQKFEGISPVTIQDMISIWKPVWNENGDFDAQFSEVVALARLILKKSIAHAEAELEEARLANDVYESASDKRVLVSEVAFSPSFFVEKPEVLFVVFPDENNNWKGVAVRAEHGSFTTRVSFPAEWGGLRDGELAEVSGIPDAVFSHRAGFLFVAKSKEGVLAAVEKVIGG